MKLITRFPDTLLIVLTILLVFTVLTWVVPAGEYDRQTVNGREVVVPGSYQPVPQQPQGVTAFFTAPIKGFAAAADIIAFIFFVGGAFSILNRTGAINAGLGSILAFSLRKPQFKWLILPLVIVLFSLAGATFGMSEEVLVFVLITIPLALALGYDSLTGVAVSFVGAGVGFAGAILNPFTVGIAQGIAGLPPFSGWEYRVLVWAVLTAVCVVYVMVYAAKVNRIPQRSAMYDRDLLRRQDQVSLETTGPLTGRRKAVLGLLVLALALLVLGSTQWGWYIEEIAGLFIALGLAAAVVNGLPSSEAVEAFVQGARDMIPAGLVVALSKGLLIVATEGSIIDTVLYAISSAAAGFPAAISIQVMFLLQSFLNFFMPSGSGQAALTMPIMAPLSDLLGISRQTAVLAFQFGDGLSNMIIPTSGVTMGVLAIADIPYGKWVRWLLPLIGLLFLTAMLLLLPPVLLFDWGPA